tara:strand:- start:1362 stop:1598 length:237 start_codon:yes stop_codon:yes gene_type:complete
MAEYQKFVDKNSFNKKLIDPYILGRNNGVRHHTCLNYETKLFTNKVKTEKKNKTIKKEETEAFPELMDPFKLIRHRFQ